jgi:hypothetical protein
MACIDGSSLCQKIDEQDALKIPKTLAITFAEDTVA